MDIMEKLNQRLGYKESMVVSRDDFYELMSEERIAGEQYDDAQREIEELEGVRKQLDMAHEIIDGLVECIDDEGAVTPEDKALLARRIATAIKFVGNAHD